MKIRIAGIVNDSIVDGPGLRLCVFAQGCPHGCEGCHNPHTHDATGGYTVDVEDIINTARENPLLKGITLSGGEPFLQAESMAYLAQRARDIGLDIIAYTGFLWEDILADKNMMKFAAACDYVVDGKFIANLRTLDTPFVGSSNQRIINVGKSLKENSVVLESW